MKGTSHLGDLGIDGSILKYILDKWGMMGWTGFFWLKTEISSRLL
jgi:hypothetical protein